MTQEYPIREKSEYLPHQPSEENGLIEDLDPDDHDPEYLLENDPEEDFTIQLDFGYFFNQREIFEYT